MVVLDHTAGALTRQFFLCFTATAYKLRQTQIETSKHSAYIYVEYRFYLAYIYNVQCTLHYAKQYVNNPN